MTKEDVRRTVDALGREERTFLEAYLKAKNLADDAAYAEEASGRLKEMKDGSKLTASELREIDQSLYGKGL